MCGICGIYSRGTAPVNKVKIELMRDIMSLRGPDGYGIHLAENIGLGHRRLSIIDLSSNGSQPMCNENGTIWLVQNGEIYNFEELRYKLTARGHFFRSRSDSEVIIHAYEEWGFSFLHRMRGMFAFGLWDSNLKQLILARDRLGQKPLFYSEANGQVYFASDIKSILSGLESDPELCSSALDSYLSYIVIPHHQTIFKNIRKVHPGTYLVFDKGGKRTVQYWNLSFENKVHISETELMEETEEKLNRAVKIRLKSDVPLGVFLSGGIDSGLVTAFASEHSTQTLKTFSIGFEEETHNELPYARAIAKKYGTDHSEIIIKANIIGNLLKCVWNHGEPFGDSSAIPSYLVAQAASDFVKVVLTGDGGDESFGGYDRTLNVHKSSKWHRFLPHSVRRSLLRAVDSISYSEYPTSNSHKSNGYFSQGARRLKHNLINVKEGYYTHIHTMGWINQRDQLYSREFRSRLSDHNPKRYTDHLFYECKDLSATDQALYADFKFGLPDDYLVKMDIATMSNSIEARSPFVDQELVEFAATIPSEIKLKGNSQMYILKQIGKKYLPEEAVFRQKWGFGIPLAVWMRTKYKKLIKRILLSDNARSRRLYNFSYLEKYLENFFMTEQGNEHRIWTLLVLELWHLMFIDKVMKPTDSLHDFL